LDGFEIRESTARDGAAIDKLYPEVFPDEDLRPLVKSLLRDTPGVLSLVAVGGGAVIGHVAFTRCAVGDGSGAAALLGPLAVAPAWQGRGVGSALVRTGFERLHAGGFDQVFVLGDPAYYRRFGFEADTAVAPPHPVPDEWRTAWQSVKLHRDAPTRQATLRVPKAWDEPALWAA
jgi:putative acetyltransferase